MSESEENHVHGPSTPILDEISCEKEYHELKEHFLRTGKGRRPTAPTISRPTYKLLLQLHCMRDDSDASWDEVWAWFQNLFPEVQDVTRGRLEYRIKTVLNACPNHTWSDNFLDTAVCFTTLPDPLEQLGFTREGLLNEDFSCHSENLCITYEVLAALELFRSKEGLSQAFLCKCILSFLPAFSDRQLRRQITVALKKIKSLKAGKKAD
ncbi:hypothetical protein PoB_001992800 [Plakobranchus ocellatus]|uniref:Uncharacterized protein n=1 Tax=Plakobranchus ocellatus TaxID=259542 RepID=A0AAV3ZF92_9GAST|nr:hypothetical protein PoB_001992800 [Plakobranchus ocellatus]